MQGNIFITNVEEIDNDYLNVIVIHYHKNLIIVVYMVTIYDFKINIFSLCMI